MRLSIKYRDPLYAALGLVGLAGWMLYILACLPTVAWSPDGTKVVFAYQQSDPDETGVALHDRTTGKTKRLFVSSDPEDGVLAGWTQDGKHAIVYQEQWYDETLNILLLPVQSDEPARLLFVGESRATFAALPPERDGDLFFGGDSLMRLDLVSGEVEKKRDLGDGGVSLAAGKDRIFYVGTETCQWEQAHRSKKQAGDDESWMLEIGTLEPKELILQPLFELEDSDVQPFGVAEVYGGIWVDPTGTRFALVGDGDERGAIVLCGRAGLERVIAPQIPWETYRLGNPQWSLDGKTLYAGIATPSDDPRELQFSLVEIPVEGGPARLVPIVKLLCGEAGKLGRDSAPLTLPTIALSPDGSTIAASATQGDDPACPPERLALFLIDLRDAQRRVNEVRPAFLRSSTEVE